MSHTGIHSGAFVPPSNEVERYPIRMKLASVDWPSLVAENLDPVSALKQAAAGVASALILNDMHVCGGIAAVSGIDTFFDCNRVQQNQFNFKPRHF